MSGVYALSITITACKKLKENQTRHFWKERVRIDDTTHAVHVSGDSTHVVHVLGDSAWAAPISGDSSHAVHVSGDTTHAVHVSGDSTHAVHVSGDSTHAVHVSGDSTHAAPISGDSTHAVHAAGDSVCALSNRWMNMFCVYNTLELCSREFLNLEVDFSISGAPISLPLFWLFVTGSDELGWGRVVGKLASCTPVIV